MDLQSSRDQLHFVLIPLLSPGHLLPMTDMAILLANHGVIVSIVTTPLNTIRTQSTIKRTVESGLDIRLLQLRFPTDEFGLPEGCENMDQLPSRDLIKNFYKASSMLQQPFEQIFKDLKPRPSCIISGKNLPWTVETATKFSVPRIFFDGMGSFSFSCSHSLEVSKVHEAVASKFEPFLIPGIPHRIELTKAQLPENLNPAASKDDHLANLRDNMINIRATEVVYDGIVVNTFEEIETEYVKEYKRVKGDKVWCIGPLSACNKLDSDQTERGENCNNPTRAAIHYLKPWLESKTLAL